jgi:uncharacterized protein
MKLDNEFTVGVPIGQAWAVLTDLELIAPCMPGAQLTGVTDGVYSGKVKIKVGPVTAEYSGTAEFSVKDETAYRAVIDARGRDSRGNGNATAVISAALQSVGEATVVSVSTDLTIAGRIAQFGSGMIKEISAKLLGKFVTCLQDTLSAGSMGRAAATAVADTAPTSKVTASRAATNIGAVGRAETSTAPATPAPTSKVPIRAGATTSAPASSPAAAAATVTADSSVAAASTGAAGAAPFAVAGPEPAALDLMGVAGRAIVKRLVPLAIGLIVLAVVIYLIIR